MLTRFALIIGIGLLAAPPALACSCLCDENAGPNAARTWLDQAAYVFRGTVVLRQTAKSPDDETGDPIRMKLSRILKGRAIDELTVYSPRDSAMCGVGWQRGDAHDVIAFRNADGKLSVGICGQVCAGKDGVFKLLEKDGRPVQ